MVDMEHRDGHPDGSSASALTDAALPDALRAHSAGRSAGFLLWHATLRWRRSIDAALRPLALTHAQFLLLTSTWWLGREGAAPNQRQVAEHAGVGEALASQVTRLLERDGLIERGPHPDDVRGKALHLTEQGHRTAERAVVAVDAADERFFGDLAARDDFLAALRQLAGRDEHGAAQPPPG